MSKTGIFVTVLVISIIGRASQCFSQPDDPFPHVVFLINDDPLNYGATTTIPGFARELENQFPCKTTILTSSGPNNRSSFSNLDAIRRADLLVIFCRRIALPKNQMDLIKDHFFKGKSIIGIRSANHAFSVRDSLPEGYVDWWNFVPAVLACENRGHGPNPEPVRVIRSRDYPRHPLTSDVSFRSWTSSGQLYRSYPLLDDQAQVVIEGTTAGQTEPLAWSRISPYDGKVFYSALGEEEDFANPSFITLLLQATRWALTDIASEN